MNDIAIWLNGKGQVAVCQLLIIFYLQQYYIAVEFENKPSKLYSQIFDSTNGTRKRREEVIQFCMKQNSFKVCI